MWGQPPRLSTRAQRAAGCHKSSEIVTSSGRRNARPLGHFLHPQPGPANQPPHGARIQRRQPENPPSLHRHRNPSPGNQPVPLDRSSKAVPRELVSGPVRNPQPIPLDAQRKRPTNNNNPHQERKHRNALSTPNPTPPTPPSRTPPPGLITALSS